MKPFLLFVALSFPTLSCLFAQEDQNSHRNAINALIDDYSKAREFQDTALLKEILMPDIDQLVSTGEWRMGMQSAIEGMQRSSKTNQGTRTLKVDKIKFLAMGVALVDARYVIENPGAGKREMWSSFLLILTDYGWKISSIRNMLPTG